VVHMYGAYTHSVCMQRAYTLCGAYVQCVHTVRAYSAHTQCGVYVWSIDTQCVHAERMHTDWCICKVRTHTVRAYSAHALIHNVVYMYGA